MIPDFRTMQYAIFRACERFQVTPPGFPEVFGKLNWDQLSAMQQARLLGYDQLANHDQEKWEAKLAGNKSPF